MPFSCLEISLWDLELNSDLGLNSAAGDCLYHMRRAPKHRPTIRNRHRPDTSADAIEVYGRPGAVLAPPKPADRLLLSSDLLRVSGWSVLR